MTPQETADQMLAEDQERRKGTFDELPAAPVSVAHTNEHYFIVELDCDYQTWNDTNPRKLTPVVQKTGWLRQGEYANEVWEDRTAATRWPNAGNFSWLLKPGTVGPWWYKVRGYRVYRVDVATKTTTTGAGHCPRADCSQ